MVPGTCQAVPGTERHVPCTVCETYGFGADLPLPARRRGCGRRSIVAQRSLELAFVIASARAA